MPDYINHCFADRRRKTRAIRPWAHTIRDITRRVVRFLALLAIASGIVMAYGAVLHLFGGV